MLEILGKLITLTPNLPQLRVLVIEIRHWFTGKNINRVYTIMMMNKRNELPRHYDILNSQVKLKWKGP